MIFLNNSYQTDGGFSKIRLLQSNEELWIHRCEGYEPNCNNVSQKGCRSKSSLFDNPKEPIQKSQFKSIGRYNEEKDRFFFWAENPLQEDGSFQYMGPWVYRPLCFVFLLAYSFVLLVLYFSPFSMRYTKSFFLRCGCGRVKRS